MRKKLISILLSAVMLISVFGTVSVFAESEFNVKIGFGAKASIYRNQTLTLSSKLDFSTDDIVIADGIRTMSYIISFDPAIFDVVDTKTGEPIEVDEFGYPVNGSLFTFGNIGNKDSLLVSLSENRDKLSVLYGGVGAENDIYTPGSIFNFKFKVKDDLELKESRTATFKISSPKVYVKNSETKVNVETENINVVINTPFVVYDVPDQEQNTEMTLSAKTSVSADSDEPIKAEIKKDGNVIEEQNAVIKNGMYTISFNLDEAKYPEGNYTLVLTHGLSTASRSFKIVKKAADIKPETPENPDDDKKDDSSNKDEDKKDNNSGSNNSGNNNNNSGSSNNNGGTTVVPSTGGNGGSTNSNGSGGTVSGTSKPSPSVKYPTDISAHWAVDNIKYVYDHALMNGYENGTFAPDANITRGEFSAVMARFLELGDGSASADKFKDLDGHWAKGYIGALAEKGVVGGVTEDSFAPDDNITREQMAAILARAFDLKVGDAEVFADNDQISDWAVEYVLAVRNAGYMNGDADNNFSPIQNATRAEVATVIYRLHSAK